MALFGVYRILISQKDSTIELLKERVSVLKEKLESESPDNLNQALSRRVDQLDEELERLYIDESTNKELISKKEDELEHATEVYRRLQETHMHISGMSASYFCRVCEEPTLYSVEAKVGFIGNDEKNFLVKYSCGYSELNREKVSDCAKSTTNKVL